MSEIIKKVDTEKFKKQYAEKKLGDLTNKIDLQARNCFPARVTNSLLKYSLGFNLNGERQWIINKNLLSNQYSNCIQKEIWTHVLIYKANFKYHWPFFQRIAKQLKKINNVSKDQEEIILLLKDINRYLQNENETNFNIK